MSQQGYLQINSLTWEKDTHGLFDYESKVVYHKKAFVITSSCNIFRTLNDCHVPEYEDSLSSTGLLRVERRPLGFQVSLIEANASSKMWLVIRKLNNSAVAGYKLSEGDWLKMGRIRFKVIGVCVQPGKARNSLLPQFFSCEKKEEQLQEEDCDGSEDCSQKSACRICLSEAETGIDPLIYPCKCAGTMKFIHLNCLKEWLKCKITAKVSDKGMSFHIKDLVCELCKSPFPFIYKYKSQRITLLNIDFPSKPYIILEEFRPDHHCRQALHLIALNSKQSASIGRGHDCEIKISDISVSRKHCKITLIDNNFYLEDLKSKFGTLAKIKKTFSLKPRYDVTVQINRTVLEIEYKVPWSIRDLCNCCGGQRVVTDSFSYLTQPEFHDSESDQENSRLHLTNSNFRVI